jgi:hypothetical protein
MICRRNGWYTSPSFIVRNRESAARTLFQSAPLVPQSARARTS